MQIIGTSYSILQSTSPEGTTGYTGLLRVFLPRRVSGAEELILKEIISGLADSHTDEVKFKYVHSTRSAASPGKHLFDQLALRARDSPGKILIGSPEPGKIPFLSLLLLLDYLERLFIFCAAIKFIQYLLKNRIRVLQSVKQSH